MGAVNRLAAGSARLVEGLTWSRALAVVFAVSLVWTVSLFAAPYTIPPNSLTLSSEGRANGLDNAAAYGALNAYAQSIYYLSDIQCHQLPYRSLFLNGNQMPMDARMTSIYAFLNLGLISAALAAPAATLSQGVVNALPGRARRWIREHWRVDFAAFTLILLALLPVAVDGFTQLFGWRESTNGLRVLTGAFTGWGTGLLLGAMITSLKQFEVEYRALRRARAAAPPDQRF